MNPDFDPIRGIRNACVLGAIAWAVIFLIVYWVVG